MKTGLLIIISVLVLIVIAVAINPISAQCAYDPAQPHKPCDDVYATLIIEPHEAQLENIRGQLFRVIGPFTLEKESNDRIRLDGVIFTYPSFPNPPMPGGPVSVTITFENGSKESIFKVGAPLPFIEFVGVDPQAGVRRNADGTFNFFLSVERQLISPLKQTKLGTESWSIACKDGQSVLSQKKHFFYDSRVACVTPETKTKLIERGWNLAAPTFELTYFDKSQEFEIGQKFEDFMKKQSYNNVPNAFVIGKHNFKNNGDITYFCGEFKEISVNYGHYFFGAIDGSGTLEWNGIQKQSAWCAINDDAHQFNFAYDWELKNEN